MASSNRPGGRSKRIVSGGGNAYKRGSGLGGGPVGGGSRPSGGGFGGSSGGTSGSRGGGGGLLAILLALLLGNSSGSTSKGGCLKRILIIVVIIAVGSFLLRSCSGSGVDLGSLLGSGGYTVDDSASTGGLTSVDEPASSSSESVSSTLESLLGSNTGYTPASTPVSSDDAVYAAHQPDYSVDRAARQRYFDADAAENVTIMVYMCGADLESKSGMATYDLQEMASASLNDNVRIIVETGGASRWQNDVVKSGKNMRFRVMQGGLKTLESNLGKRSMVEPDTLSDFIRYSKENFPADRYMLIFWNHGGGSITGYGYDELFANDGSMSLEGINTALKDGGCQFDFIGFDACLMATLETALVAEQYADYMIASEATEPGTGWYYTTWLSQLAADPSMKTVDVGKQIVDDFVKYSAQGSSSNKATLSLIDLAELSGTVPAAFTAFSTATNALISNDGYSQVATARSSARDFSSGTRINQIDLVHFAENLATNESNALAEALRGCVKYNRNSSNISHANGVSIYFPYNSLSKVSTAIQTYNAIGLDESYTEFIRSFASMASAGQVTSGSSTDALGSLLGDDSGSLLGSLLGSTLTGGETASASGDTVTQLLDLFLQNRSAVTGDRDSSWVNESLVRAQADVFEKNNAGFANLMLTYKGDVPTLVLSEEQWSAVVTLEQNVFIDDGEGYIDLGLDNVMEYDEDNDLIMAYDGTWMSLNGQIVAYYLVSDDRVGESYSIVGRVPAMHNGTRVNIILEFTSENPYGTVLGAQTDYEATTDTVMKGLVPIEAGDTLDFLCDFYNYDGTFSDAYYLGEQMTATGEWTIGNAPLGDNVKWQMTYRITDEFGGQYWTPTIQN